MCRATHQFRIGPEVTDVSFVGFAIIARGDLERQLVRRYHPDRTWSSASSASTGRTPSRPTRRRTSREPSAARSTRRARRSPARGRSRRSITTRRERWLTRATREGSPGGRSNNRAHCDERRIRNMTEASPRALLLSGGSGSTRLLFDSGCAAGRGPGTRRRT